MTIKKLAVFAIAIALILGTLTLNSYVTAKDPMQYEYLVQGKREMDRKEGEGLAGEFNHLGNQGWEFVGVIPGEGDAYSVIFVRPKVSE
ncbi:MAG: hypothetical protein O7G87_15750 [bacterium]|nr:hypothetical protein [bacterium]